MNNKELADLIFPSITKTIADYEAMYPSRGEGHITSRIAPSPTGFLHVGSLYAALVSQKYCEQNNGTYFLRIEDTDTARTVEGAADLFIQAFKFLGLTINEGPLGHNHADVGNYGPYYQSQRKEIYHAFVKHLVAEGKAYPCWMTPEEMDATREEQMALKKAPGIYGNYSLWRNKTPQEYADQLEQHPEGFVIRLRSPGDANKRVIFNDLNRGNVSMPENINDIVLIKSDDKLPTYHLAHLVDDHLMRTTHVIRGDEWLVSVPLHIQLYEMFGYTPLQYCHVAPILKSEDGKKRKLSKRHDPEANVEYFFENGYAKEGLLNYLISLIDSSYEAWMEAHPEKNHRDFPIVLEHMNSSGALIDMDKMKHINNSYLSKLSNEHLYAETLEWAEKHRPYLAELMNKNPEYTLTAIGIERHTDKDPKRFTTFLDVENQIKFFYDSEFALLLKNKPELPSSIDSGTMLDFISEYESVLDFSMETMDWFAQLKDLAKKYGFAGNNKEFRDGGYVGTIGDVAMFMRIQLACATQTPDLYSMMKVMGKERVMKRLREGLS